MLSRASTDAGTRLRRSKSSSIVHQRTQARIPELTDPVIAHRHAVVAATTAYERAHPTGTTAAATDSSTHDSRRRSNTGDKFEGRHFPKRGSSVEFSQRADASGNGVMAGRISQRRNTAGPDMAPVSGSKHGTPVTWAQAVANGQERPRAQTGVRHDTDSLPAYNRRIRKAQSMYYANSSLQSRMHDPAEQAIYSSPRTLHSEPDGNVSMMSEPDGSLAAKAALGSPDLSREQSISMARDKILADFQQRRLRERASFYLGPFKKRQERGNQIVHTQSTTVTYDNIPPASSTLDGTAQLAAKVEKKRSFSNSLKSKIKRVFRKSSNGLGVFPPQQVEASRPYFDDYNLNPSVIPSTYGYDGIPSSGPERSYRSRSQTPPFGYGSPCLPSGSRESSAGRSEEEISVAKSRVTSWTNSSPGNTVAIREMHRLSTIDEASRPSMAFSTPKRPSSSKVGRNSFQKPSPHAAAADSRRVYSALMKKIEKGAVDDGNPSFSVGGDFDPIKQILENLPSHTRLPSTTSGASKATKSTIRTVTTDDQTTESGTRSIRGPVRIPRHISISTENDGSSITQSVSDVNVDSELPKKRGLFLQRLRLQKLPKAAPPTPEQISRRMEKARDRWKTPLEEGHSPVHPNTTKRFFASRSFSGRDARLAAVGVLESVEEDTASVHVDGTDDKYISRGDPTPIPGRLLSPISPSVYSREIDYKTPSPNGRRSNSSGHSEENTGTAIIIASQPVARYSLGSPPPRIVSHSARSSRDWQAWLSKQIDELGSPPGESIRITEQYAAPPSGNNGSGKSDNSRRHREQAQVVDGEDTSIGGSKGAMYQNAVSMPQPPALIERPTSRMNERFPMIETGRKPSNQNARRKRKKTNSPDAEISTGSQSSKTLDKRAPEEGSRIPVPKETTVRRIQATRTQHPRMNRPQSLQRLNHSARSNSSLAYYTTSAEEMGQGERSATPSPPKSRPSTGYIPYRPKSSVDLGNRYANPDPLNYLRRKPITGRQLEGDTLRMILEGPYSSANQSPEHNKENSPAGPPFDLSTYGFVPGGERPRSQPISSNVSPSPGQRMVDRFLSERSKGDGSRLMNESPVFL